MDFDLKKWAPWNWFKKGRMGNRARATCCKTDGPRNLPSSSLDPCCTCIARWIACSKTFRGFGVHRSRLAPPTSASPWLFAAPGPRPPGDGQAVPDHWKSAPASMKRTSSSAWTTTRCWIRGEKRQEQEHKDGQYHRVERSYGSFQRALNLPEDADRDAIQASFKKRRAQYRHARPARPSAQPPGRTIPIN